MLILILLSGMAFMSNSYMKDEEKRVAQQSESSHLLEFYGEGCPPCVRMNPLVARLEKEENVKVEKLEVWHNSENAKKMEEYDQGRCGAVPFFYNTKNDRWICGATTYEELREWALSK
jgi:thiol-disulfide isomerase/thioredoxin